MAHNNKRNVRLRTWPVAAFLFGFLTTSPKPDLVNPDIVETLASSILIGVVLAFFAVPAALIANPRLGPTKSRLPFSDDRKSVDGALVVCTVLALAMKLAGIWGAVPVLVALVPFALVGWGGNAEEKRYREELVAKLREMISHPDTPEERRALAIEKLGKLEGRKVEPLRTPAPEPLLAAAGSPEEPLPPISATNIEPRDLAGLKFDRKIGRALVYALGAAVLLNLLLIVSGDRILIYETIIEPGESYSSEGWTYSHEERRLIACRYWTGRNVKSWVGWYGFEEDETDECQLIFDPND